MDFLIKCQNLFLGLVSTADEEENGDGAAAKDTEGEASDDDVDGMPLTAAAALAAKGGHTHIPGIGLGYVVVHFLSLILVLLSHHFLKLTKKILPILLTF